MNRRSKHNVVVLDRCRRIRDGRAVIGVLFLHVPTHGFLIVDGMRIDWFDAINFAREEPPGEAAGGCGGVLNLSFVVLGDKCGLYSTGQYSSDGEERVVRSQAPSIAQKRSSSEAAGSPVNAHGSAGTAMGIHRPVEPTGAG